MHLPKQSNSLKQKLLEIRNRINTKPRKRLDKQIDYLSDGRSSFMTLDNRKSSDVAIGSSEGIRPIHKSRNRRKLNNHMTACAKEQKIIPVPDYLTEFRCKREEEQKSKMTEQVYDERGHSKGMSIDQPSKPNNSMTHRNHKKNVSASMFKIREKARKLDTEIEKKEKQYQALGGNFKDCVQIENMIVESVAVKLEMLDQINML